MGQCQTKRQIRRKRKAKEQESTFTANNMFGIWYAMKRKKREAKSGEMPKAVQRVSPLALAFPFCDLPNLSRRVLVWRSEATPLVYSSTRQSAFLLIHRVIWLKNSVFCDILIKNSRCPK